MFAQSILGDRLMKEMLPRMNLGIKDIHVYGVFHLNVSNDNSLDTVVGSCRNALCYCGLT